MTQTDRVTLARRPAGMPVALDFRFETVPLPAPAPGEARVRTIYLSLDPYMRGRMSDAPSYAPSVELGGVITGEVVGEVEEDTSGRFAPGQIVRGFGGWQSRFVAKAEGLTPVDPGNAPISTALGALGMPGFTAYAGLEAIGKPKPGETLVVSAASGPVGAMAGQLARLKGLRTVGIAGGAEKCRHVTGTLGFDVCLDRRLGDLPSRLEQACPDGIDIYMELAGGQILEAVLPLMNLHGRIPVIGLIAWYNLSQPPAAPDQLPALMRRILTRRLLIQGMIVWDYDELRPAFEREVGEHLRSGRILNREDIVDGLENAPQAFIGLLEGRNFGKLLVRVGPEPEVSGGSPG